MKINDNSVSLRYGELFELLHQRDRDLFQEVLETLTEVVEVAYETNPHFNTSYSNLGDKSIEWSEDSIQFAFAEVA